MNVLSVLGQDDPSALNHAFIASSDAYEVHLPTFGNGYRFSNGSVQFITL